MDDMVKAATMLQESADVIDLNFGCPAPKVTSICAGAALMGEPQRLVTMVENIVEAVDVPVTAKMRLGTGQGPNTAVIICQSLEKVGAQRLCIHGRTLRQRYSGIADWETIQTAVNAVEVPVVANGDITDANSARLCLEQTNASGLMIGRAALGDQTSLLKSRSGLVGWKKKSYLGSVNTKVNGIHCLKLPKLLPLVDGVGMLHYAVSRDHRTCETNNAATCHCILKRVTRCKSVRTLMHELTDVNESAQAISEFLKPISEG